MNESRRLLSELADRRRVLGISQAEMARALGVPQSNVSRLEKGAHDPTLSNALNFAQVLGLRIGVCDHGYKPATPASCAIEVRKLLEESPPDSTTAFRVVTELVSDWELISDDRKAQFVAQKPVTTRSPKFDAFISGVVEMLCVRSGVPTPSWVRDPEYFLEKFEWFTPVAALEALAFANTPSSLALRGVFIDERSLESV